MPLKTQAWDHYWESNATLNSFAFDYSATEGPYKRIMNFGSEHLKNSHRQILLLI